MEATIITQEQFDACIESGLYPIKCTVNGLPAYGYLKDLDGHILGTTTKPDDDEYFNYRP